MSDVTVYGKPGCRACVGTTRELKKRGIDYTYVDFTQDAEAEAMLKSEGVMAAPFVTSPIGKWSGLDEAQIDKLAASR